MALKQFLVRGERKKRTLALKQVLVGGKTELDVVDDLFSKKKSQCRSVSYPVWAPYADFFVLRMRACTKRNSTPKTRASHPKPRKNEAVADIHIKYFLDIIVIEAGRYSYERFLRYY